MSEKAVGNNGLLYFWQKICNIFVKKETGKGLSSNDYTTEEKMKLYNIAEGANKITVVDTLTSTSTTDALSAKQGKVLDEKITAINTNMENLGGGDMLKSVYDTDGNGKVDNADNAEKFGGELPSAYVKQSDLETLAPNSHTHAMGEINGLSEKTKELTEIASGKCHSEVFNTTEEMNTWIADTENIKNLKVGDVFLIRAVDVPDYWWDGSAAQVLETTKVELNFITNEEIDAIVATS